MSLKELEKAVQSLPKNDLETFANWFDELRADLWDKQIEEDANAGKFDKLAEQAIKDFREGKFTKL
jgi:hypothetical protein